MSDFSKTGDDDTEYIQADLHVSATTVESHLERMAEQLGVDELHIEWRSGSVWLTVPGAWTVRRQTLAAAFEIITDRVTEETAV